MRIFNKITIMKHYSGDSSQWNKTRNTVDINIEKDQIQIIIFMLLLSARKKTKKLIHSYRESLSRWNPLQSCCYLKPFWICYFLIYIYTSFSVSPFFSFYFMMLFMVTFKIAFSFQNIHMWMWLNLRSN